MSSDRRPWGKGTTIPTVPHTDTPRDTVTSHTHETSAPARSLVLARPSRRPPQRARHTTRAQNLFAAPHRISPSARDGEHSDHGLRAHRHLLVPTRRVRRSTTRTLIRVRASELSSTTCGHRELVQAPFLERMPYGALALSTSILTRHAPMKTHGMIILSTRT